MSAGWEGAASAVSRARPDHAVLPVAADGGCARLVRGGPAMTTLWQSDAGESELFRSTAHSCGDPIQFTELLLREGERGGAEIFTKMGDR